MYNIYTNNGTQYQPGAQYIPTGNGQGQPGYTGGWSTGPSLLSMNSGSTSQSAFDVSSYGNSTYGSYGNYGSFSGLPSSLLAYGAQKARQINDQLGLSSMFANLHAILTMPFPTSSSSSSGSYGSSSYTGASSSSGRTGSSGSSDSSSSSSSSGSNDSSGSSGSAGSTGSTGSSGSAGSAGSAASSASSGSAGSAGSSGSSPGSVSSSGATTPLKGGKEGLGISDTSSNGDGSGMAGQKASWYYDWSPYKSSKVNDPNAQFIPMIWGAKDMNPDALKAAKESDSPMILTFNEPDHPGQASMSVDEALSHWDQLEATGKKLSSPAITNGPDGIKWLDEFMSKAKAQGKQVDSISIHWYGSSGSSTEQNLAALRDHINQVHEKYPDKPINLTEFGLDASGLTATLNPDFLSKAEKMLNDMSYVQMYAPYGAGAKINGNG